MSLPPQIAEAQSLVGSGRAAEAVALLQRLAREGDPPALYQLAEWCREGSLLEQDFATARELYRRAGAAGIVEAMRRYLAFSVVGVGGPRDWPGGLRLLEAMVPVDPGAARQLELLGAMNLSDEGDPKTVPQPETLHDRPWVARVPGFFSLGECEYLADLAQPLFEPAPTVDERTGRLIMNPVRTSDTAVFPWVGENPVVHALNRRIAAVSGTAAEQGEPLQVLRYRPGQEYRPHIDAIPGMDNQRILTALVYLNDDYEGGETQFPKLGFGVRGRRGDALLFANVDGNGRPDPEAIHAGLPVTSGAKLLASRWVRARGVKA